jgi:hypothetical protein
VVQGCYDSVTEVLRKCHRGVTRTTFYDSVTRVLQEYHEGVPGVSQGCHRGVTEFLQRIAWTHTSSNKWYWIVTDSNRQQRTVKNSDTRDSNGQEWYSVVLKCYQCVTQVL